MKQRKFLQTLPTILLGISSLAILSVSLMAFADPRAVMALVQVELNNNDALSSVRGVFGGVGITLFVLLLWIWRKDRRAAIGSLALLWGLYAFSRALTVLVDGPLGDFGTQWITIEALLCLACAATWVALGSSAPQRVGGTSLA